MPVRGAPTKKGEFTGRLTFNVDSDERVHGLSRSEMQRFYLAGKPLFYEHKTAKPPVGNVDGSWVGDDGWMYVRGKLNMQDARAQRVWNKIESGRVRGLSIGFRAGLSRDDSTKSVYKTVREVSLTKCPAEAGAEIITNHSSNSGEIQVVTAAIEFLNSNYYDNNSNSSNQQRSTATTMDPSQQQQQSLTPQQAQKSLLDTIQLEGNQMHHLHQMRQFISQQEGGDPTAVDPEDAESVVTREMAAALDEPDKAKRTQILADLIRAKVDQRTRPILNQRKQVVSALQRSLPAMEAIAKQEAKAQEVNCRRAFAALLDGEDGKEFNNEKTRNLVMSLYGDPELAPIRQINNKLVTRLDATAKRCSELEKIVEEFTAAEKKRKQESKQPFAKRQAVFNDFAPGNSPFDMGTGEEVAVEHSASAVSSALAAARAYSTPEQDQMAQRLKRLPAGDDGSNDALAAIEKLRQQMSI